MADDGWRWADAWIFVSVVIAGGAGRHRRSPSTRRPEGIRLADVLSTADHLNRAIPTRKDVEVAVRRLGGAGLISVSDGWFQLTPAGETLWRTRPRCGMSTVVDTVHSALLTRYEPGAAQWRLGDDEHGAAVQEYLVRRMAPAPRRPL
ncbi:hypothetical protein SAMN05444365_105232 [Micromonospora pattaloongensis]|uniref:Uncharacterized protein n=1 Tax=Micromonospora pattaloongensis TaxID=405436 RepID=A0A1H3Q467_9ACTN|nr:hypothetical protein [Micromonospora pattaloongensis]SDZ08294.1 hypothetical protein SAMN05444365_105232 [Micromonospora pattaloongensis]